MLIFLLIFTGLCKEIQPVHSEGDQPWDFFGGNDVEAETPVFWPPHEKSWLIGKDSDAGSDWGQEEKGTTEDEMTGWHHWLDGRQYEWTLGVGDRQGGLACCDSWGRKESVMTEQLNWTDTRFMVNVWFFLFLEKDISRGLNSVLHLLACGFWQNFLVLHTNLVVWSLSYLSFLSSLPSDPFMKVLRMLCIWV